MAEIATAYVNVVPQFDPNIPRIQILELPMEHNGDYSTTPFAIVFDGVDNDDLRASLSIEADHMKHALHARGVIFFEGRVQV